MAEGLAASATRRISRQSGRAVEYALSSTDPSLPLAVLFPPLFGTAPLVCDADFASAATAARLRVLCVSRPGVGDSAPVGEGPDTAFEAPQIYDPLTCRSGSGPTCTAVEARLATHAADVAAVLRDLDATSNIRVIGVCAGAPYALAFFTQHPTLVSATHITLVTPWCPGDCPEHKGLVRLAAGGWLGPHAAIGSLLAVAPTLVPAIILRGPGDVQKLAAGLYESERAEFARQVCYAYADGYVTH